MGDVVGSKGRVAPQRRNVPRGTSPRWTHYYANGWLLSSEPTTLDVEHPLLPDEAGKQSGFSVAAMDCSTWNNCGILPRRPAANWSDMSVPRGTLLRSPRSFDRPRNCRFRERGAGSLQTDLKRTRCSSSTWNSSGPGPGLFYVEHSHLLRLGAVVLHGTLLGA